MRRRTQQQRSSGAALRAGVSVLVLAAVLLSTGLSACGSASVDVPVRVDGSPIADAVVDHWLSVIDGRSGSEAQRSSQRNLVLSFLIFSRWILGEAAVEGIRVSNDEAQARLELLGDGQSEVPATTRLPGERLLPTLLAKARGHSDKLWLLRLAVLTTRLEAKIRAKLERRVNSAQIGAYYRKHQSQYELPERRDIEWIVTYNEAWLAKAVAEIRAGKNFISVAKRVTVDASPVITGMVRHPAAENELAKHVFAAKPHVLMGPYKQSANRYEFEVTRVVPARRQTLAESEREIRRRLAATSASTAFVAMLERRWGAKTNCRSGEFVDGCAGYNGAQS